MSCQPISNVCGPGTKFNTTTKKCELVNNICGSFATYDDRINVCMLNTTTHINKANCPTTTCPTTCNVDQYRTRP